MSESLPEMSASAPCHSMGLSNEHDSMHAASEVSESTSDVTSSPRTPICCVARVPVAPKTEKVAHPVIQVVESITGELVMSATDMPPPIAPEADESPPWRLTIPLHVLLSCFLT